jgi:RNA polymerase sigma-70 factor (ECF subfamily)
MDDSFGEQLLTLLPRLRRFAISLTGSREVADDLVQTACEKALSAAGSWTPGTRFDAWMFRILRNAWIDRLRRRRTEGIVENISAHEELAAVSGEADAETKLMLKTVWQLIGNLPADQREVVLLVCVEELTYSEAAEALEVPVGTVMSRLARAREKISAGAGIERGPKR